MKRCLLVLTAMLALFAGQAYAQRCLPKMKGVELRTGMTVLTGRKRDIISVRHSLPIPKGVTNGCSAVNTFCVTVPIKVITFRQRSLQWKAVILITSFRMPGKYSSSILAGQHWRDMKP